MLAPLLLLWPMSVMLTWFVAQGIANRPYDRALVEMVEALGQQVRVQTDELGQRATDFMLPASAAELLRTDETDDIYYQVLGLRGEFLSGAADLPVPEPGFEGTPAPRASDSGRPTPGGVRFRDDVIQNEPVRVAWLWVRPSGAGTDGSAALVQVAETLGKRSRLATEIIKGVILPQFVILPLAVALVWLALSRGIAPLNEMQQRIRSRESHDLSPIDEREAPEEVAPFVRAINDLLARLDQSIGTQKRFLADAAHQLKTPLAGLRTQAELAQREIDAGERDPQALKRSLRQIALSSQRAANMVNQLLALARAERNGVSLPHEPLALSRLAIETVRDFVPRALDKRIDLGYEGPQPGEAALQVGGNRILLRELIRNLVDNALNYTPDGGTVTVRVTDDPFGQVVALQVEDTGPGIAPAEREQVFQPFYRTLGTDADGSGLGLAIVREIAEQHRVTISIDETRPAAPSSGPDAAPPMPGARFTLRFHALAPQGSGEAAAGDPASGTQAGTTAVTAASAGTAAPSAPGPGTASGAAGAAA